MQHLRVIIVDSVAAVVSPILGGQQIHGNNIQLQNYKSFLAVTLCTFCAQVIQS